MNGTIQKWGNSCAVRIPKGALESADFKENDTVVITAENGQIVIRLAERRHKTLRERLCSFSGEYAGAEWDTGPSASGEEL